MKNKKLCDWNKTEINENRKLLLSIVKEGKFYCKKCARSVNNGNYLCKPEKIK